MGFIPHRNDGSNSPQSLEWLICASGETPKVGMALKYGSSTTAGKLVKCTGTTKPEYICMTERASSLSADELIPVLRILPDWVFAVPAQADASEVKDGSKVTIHTDGLQVTATTGSGVCEIVGREGDGDVGDTLYVRITKEV